MLAVVCSIVTSQYLPFKFQNVKRIDIVRQYVGKKYKPKRSRWDRWFGSAISLFSDVGGFLIKDFNLIAWAYKIYDGRGGDIFSDMGSKLYSIAVDSLQVLPAASLFAGFGILANCEMFVLDKLGIYDLAYDENPSNTFIELHGIVLDYDNGYSHSNSPTFQCIRTRSWLTVNSGRTTNGTIAPYNMIPTPIGSACIFRNSSGKLVLATTLSYKGPNSWRDVGYNVAAGFVQEDIDKTNEFLRSMLGAGYDKTAADFIDGCDALLGDLITIDNLTALPATIENYTDEHLTNVSNTPEVGAFKLATNRSKVTSSNTVSDINKLIRY